MAGFIKKESLSPQKGEKAGMRRQIIKLRGMVLAVFFLAMFFILVYIGIKIAPQDMIDPQTGIISSVDPELKLFSDILRTIASGFLGIGALSIAWQLVMNKKAVEDQRDNLLETLLNPEATAYIDAEWRKKFLDKLIDTLPDVDSGQLFRYQHEREKNKRNYGTRKDFRYIIQIEKSTYEGFYKASVSIQFSISDLKNDFSIRYATRHSDIEYHRLYSDLVNQHPTDIYRYILFTSNELPTSQDDVFKVKKCKINGVDFIAKASTTDVENFNLTFSPNGELSDDFWIANEAKNYRIVLDLEALIDSTWNCFPIFISYTVKDFETRCEIKGIDNVSGLEIVDYFTATAPFERDSTLSSFNGFVSAGGSLKGTVLPDSGLVYIWK